MAAASTTKTDKGITLATSSKQTEVSKVEFKADGTLRASFQGLKQYKSAGGQEILQSSSNDEIYTLMANGFVGAVHQAYSKHHGLVIRPDDVWTCLATQFSRYVDANGETLRKSFVSHKGQKELVVVYESGSLRTGDYADFAQKIIDIMGKHLKNPDIRKWLIPTFTTTTVNDKVVNSVVMMSAMQKYFKYTCFFRCGLPRVTLLGTLDDWKTLREKVNGFLTYDVKDQMKRWVALLGPILDEFVNSFRGKVNLKFWDTICSDHGGGSGPSYISGWLTAFCVFDHEGKWADARDNSRQYKDFPYPVVETENVPSGVVFVPVKVVDPAGEYTTQMMAGQIGFNVINGDTLQPRSDWAIALVDPKKIGATTDKDDDKSDEEEEEEE